MRYIVTAEEMRAMDAATIEGIGLPGVVLMENAGRGVAERILQELRLGEDAPAEPNAAVVCGAGNNGGDGYVIARCLREAGVHATVYLAAAKEKIRGDARIHFDVYEQVGGLAVSIADPAGVAEHKDEIRNADVLVDCVFGTGLDRPVEGRYREIIELMNQATGFRVAVDIPSGLSADTGETLGVAVTADCTVTMAFLKTGLVVSPGFAKCGDVQVAEIGIPRTLAQAQGIRLGLVEDRDMAALLPPVPPLAHKTSRGHVLLVAGSPGKRGAARLAGWGALRVGAGLATIASAGRDIWHQDPLMTAELDPDAEADAGVGTLTRLAQGKRCVAMGPGMPTSEAGKRLVYGALEELDQTLVLDADALNHLGAELERVARAKPPVILTPHPGEAARLLGTDTRAIERDRVSAARELAAESRAVVVLKGARTVVCDGTNDLAFTTVNPTGNSALASAGTGDVLTGVVAGLAAQGLRPDEAARLGVFLHGRAGDLAAARLGPRGVTASDVAEAIPDATRSLE